ncbi:MAG TPA: hypothetical protein VF058_07380 [Actinomycetota bacterium]
MALAVLSAGYMVMDGTRALVRGDYLTPSSGAHAGRLGPWAGIVRALGIEPRSMGMKAFFVIYGTVWLAVTVTFALGVNWSWLAMLALAIGSLWYLIPGTLLSAVIIALLLIPSVREVF